MQNRTLSFAALPLLLAKLAASRRRVSLLLPIAVCGLAAAVAALPGIAAAVTTRAAVPQPAPAAASPATAAATVTGWQAVLIAGDDEQPVFDNAVAAFDRWLHSLGVPQNDIHRLSAHHDDRTAAAPASDANVLAQIAGLQPQPGQGCLVFVTSHGKEDEGVWLAYNHEFLWAVSLARSLGEGCRNAPTVVIVSSCYSGAFTTGSMRAPNRIILSAARADRPSFGCQADRTYTVFDECLLHALTRATDWHGVYRDELACVHDREHRMRVLASQPQAFFGAEVRRLSVR